MTWKALLVISTSGKTFRGQNFVLQLERAKGELVIATYAKSCGVDETGSTAPKSRWMG
jgi:hypothetical protein